MLPTPFHLPYSEIVTGNWTMSNSAYLSGHPGTTGRTQKVVGKKFSTQMTDQRQNLSQQWFVVAIQFHIDECPKGTCQYHQQNALCNDLKEESMLTANLIYSMKKVS